MISSSSGELMFDGIKIQALLSRPISERVKIRVVHGFQDFFYGIMLEFAGVGDYKKHNFG